MGVEPRNAACAPSTATSDALNHFTTEASQKKDAQIANITTPDAAVHSVEGFYELCLFYAMNYDISLSLKYDTVVL